MGWRSFGGAESDRREGRGTGTDGWPWAKVGRLKPSRHAPGRRTGRPASGRRGRRRTGQGVRRPPCFRHRLISAEDQAIRAAAALFSDLDASIDLRNEARVHLWYEDKFGVAAQPFTSARGAINAFASTTCCLGVTSTPSGVEVYAPHGLEDVFALHMRPNPRLALQVVYEAKVSQYQRRWPSLTATAWPT